MRFSRSREAGEGRGEGGEGPELFAPRPFPLSLRERGKLKRETAAGRSRREQAMKVMASVKKMCRKCKLIRRKRVVRVICTDPRHKQRQG